MYCPKCGAENQSEKYCRACGQDLTLVSQALSKSAPMMLVGQIGNELKLYKDLRRKPSITRGAYFTAIGLILLVFNSFILLYRGGPLSFSLGLNVLVALFFLGKGVKDLVKYKRSIALEAQDNQKLPAPFTEALPPTQSPSITESTTQRLDVKHQEAKDIK